MAEETKDTSVATQEKNELAMTNGSLLQFSQEKVEVIRRTVAKGATNDELEMFMHLAQRYQLDPFTKEIWFIKRPKKQKDNKGNYDYKRLENGEIDYEGVDPIIMTSRDGYLKVAQTDPDFEGMNSFEIRKKDNFSFNPMTNEMVHDFGSDRGEITGAWAICKKKGRDPAIAVVDFREYNNAAGSNPVWKSYPSAMIKKVAEVIVLKRQFNISGLVTEEEMPKQYSLEYDDPNLQRLEQNHQYKNNAIDTQAPQKNTDDEWKQHSKAIKELKEKLGFDDKKMHSIALFEIAIDSDPRNWTLPDIKKVKEYLEAELEKQQNAVSSSSNDDPFGDYSSNVEPPSEENNE
ncbi:RecT family recombinase [Alkalicoccobacillus porphyridii]|uniref:Recombinase RecT n=1 Tax=Alkalicoccobacillus porphyridii TaxID=2597270 RepID=A0A554A0C1_9BACI|nr:RecT family recombinase [Alkalicoccobacillus porphyridii]TSB47147.1 recombinase RecT [Alkalicoccobacillus porphyridii]